MLTPRFKLSQDDSHVYISVHAPYTNIAETEIDVDGENFLFVSSPYFLRLQIPGRIVENEKSKGSYDSTAGVFNLTFDKVNVGEHFDNLDMITSLLAPRDIPDMNPTLVEALEEDGVFSIDDSDNIDNGLLNNCYTFGFANRISTEFRDIGQEFPQIFELRVPEEVALDDRHILRIEHENNKFSSDHYLADYFDDELLQPYIDFKMPWASPDFIDTDFNNEEVSVLKELPNKNYLMSQTECNEVLLGLADILFCYCYDKRSTLNDSSVESSWTINKLSSTLSWFCTFSDAKEVLVACYRRALVYPIFRNFDLCNTVKEDLVCLLNKGKRFIVKCLIDIHTMFNLSNDARYILNQLYIKDYLVFIQKCKNDDLVLLYQNLAAIEIKKSDLNLDLELLEETAQSVQEEELGTVENEVAVRMASMSLLPGMNRNNYLQVTCDDSDDDENDDSSSSNSSSDSSSDDSSSSELDSDDEPS